MVILVKRTRRANPNYQAMADFRYAIRRYLKFSERAAQAAGLEPQQYQALLELKGMPNGQKATIGDLAERLQVRHHSAVGLINRLEANRLIRRSRGRDDRREVQVRLAPRGEKVLRRLAGRHHAELQSAGKGLLRALDAILAHAGRSRNSGSTGTSAAMRLLGGRRGKRTGNSGRRSLAAS